MEASVLDLIAGFMPVIPAVAPAAAVPTAAPRENNDCSARSQQHASAAANDGLDSEEDGGWDGEEIVPVVHLICFSKNRAFQLDQLLKSAKQHLCGVAGAAGDVGDDNNDCPIQGIKAREPDESPVVSLDKPSAGGVGLLRISVLYLVAQDEVLVNAMGSTMAPAAVAADMTTEQKKQEPSSCDRDYCHRSASQPPSNSASTSINSDSPNVAQQNSHHQLKLAQQKDESHEESDEAAHVSAAITTAIGASVSSSEYEDSLSSNAVVMSSPPQQALRQPECRHDGNYERQQTLINVQASYDLVIRRHPEVNFVRESPGQFADQLRELVRRSETGRFGAAATGEECRRRGDFVLFAVDDMFFYRDFEVADATRLLHEDASVYSVHLRLHPGITWSHTAGSACRVPPLAPTTTIMDVNRGSCGGVSGVHAGGKEATRTKTSDGWQVSRRAAEFGLLTFVRAEGSGEWDYPWDLTGGLYRRTDAEAVVDGIIDSYGKITGAGNPNLVEFNGNRLLRLQQGHKSRGVVETVTTTKVPISMTEASPAAAIAAAAPRCGCAGLAVVSSLAVNRVQSTYSTPVYASRGGGVEDLHRKLWSGVVVPDDGVRNVSSAEASVVAVAAAGATIEGLAEMATGKVGKRCAERDVRMQGDPGFDGSAYRGLVYNSVHVGDLMFAAVGGATDDVPTDSIGCSDSGGGGGGGSCDSGKTEQAGRSNADTKPCSAADSSDATRNMRGDCVASSSSSAATATTAANYRMDTGGSAAAQTSSPVVTVLLPVKNGGVHLLDAVASVLDCAARSHELEGAMELLIVDDGSDDGAVSIAVAAARGQPIPGDNIDPSMTAAATAVSTAAAAAAARDTAVANITEGRGEGGDARETGDGQRSCCSIRVIRHDQSQGLAHSLNEGLREARSELVARMDADDVCMPSRFERQLAFMSKNPGVLVLGSSVATFSGECVRNPRNLGNMENAGNVSPALRDRHGEQLDSFTPLFPPPPPPPPPPTPLASTKQPHPRHHHQILKLQVQNKKRMTMPPVVLLSASSVQRIARHPTDPALLAWSLFFGCSIAHPSVMLRRSAALDVGGYDPSTEPAEDYDLWLRLETAEPGSLANIGEVLLGLRKHRENLSRARRDEQAAAALASAARAMTRLLGRSVTAARASVVRAPEEAATAAELADGARLLGELESALVERMEMGENGKGEDEERDHEYSRRGTELIRSDAEARLGAMVVHAMSRFGGDASPVLAEWRARYPGRPLLQLLAAER